MQERYHSQLIFILDSERKYNIQLLGKKGGRKSMRLYFSLFCLYNMWYRSKQSRSVLFNWLKCKIFLRHEPKESFFFLAEMWHFNQFLQVMLSDREREKRLCAWIATVISSLSLIYMLFTFTRFFYHCVTFMLWLNNWYFSHSTNQDWSKSKLFSLSIWNL